MNFLIDVLEVHVQAQNVRRFMGTTTTAMEWKAGA